MKATIRNWNKNEALPTAEGFIVLPNIEYEVNQPDNLDDEEFNLLVTVKNKILTMRSIDFNFK